VNSGPTPQEAPPVTVGIDLGGTGTRVVALDAHGVVRHQLTTPTPTGLPPERTVAGLLAAVTSVADGCTLQGVGVGASGPVDAGGVIRNPDTLPAFSDIPLTRMITDHLRVPCVIDNDSVTAAIGEHNYGAGRASNALLVLTLGTGIGVAMLIEGRPVRAADGSHPEAGHIAIPGPPAPCYCGLPICWEQLASRTALNTLTRHTTDDLAVQARAGAPAATRLFDQYGQHVGAGLATLLTLYRPDRVLIGGGAGPHLDLFRAGMTRRLHRSATYQSSQTVVTAELGNIAGAVGAAVMSRQHP